LLLWPPEQQKGKMQSNSTVDCPCTSVQFFIKKREGAAFIGVAYSTDQLETKTKRKITSGLGDLRCHKDYR
jgi:hypothetical protein